MLYGGHRGVVACMYRFEYLYTLILEYVWIGYWWMHVLYVGHSGVAVYMYSFGY